MTSPPAISNTVERLFRELKLTGNNVRYEKAQPWVLTPGTASTYELTVGPFRFDAEKYIALAKPHALTRAMSDQEKKAMKNSIFLNGVQSEIYLDSTGRVVDGHHRVFVCAEELIEEGKAKPIPYKVIEFPTTDQEYEFIVLHHLVRRHFNLADKRKLVEVLLLAGHDGTAGFLAEMASLSTNTVKALMDKMHLQKKIQFLEDRRDPRGSYHKQLHPNAKSKSKPDHHQVVGLTSRRGYANEDKSPIDVSDVAFETTDSRVDASKAMAIEERSNPKTDTQAASANFKKETEQAATNLDAVPEDNVLSEQVEQAKELDQITGASKDLAADERGSSISDAQAASANLKEKPEQAANKLDAVPEDVVLSKRVDHAKKLVQIPDTAESDVEVIAELWWDAFGIVPVTAQDLQKLVEANTSPVLQAYRSGNLRVLGKALKKMTNSEDGRFLALYKQVCSASIYCLRPRAWSKHGPE